MNVGFGEYAEAPSTPGLVEQPNSSNAQEALVSDDHMDLEDHKNNDLVPEEGMRTASNRLDLHQEVNITTDSNHDSVQCKLPEENGYHGDLIEPTTLVADCSEGKTGEQEGPQRTESSPNISIPPVESCRPKLDESTVSPSCSQVTFDMEGPNSKTHPGSTDVPVSESELMDDQASIKTKIDNNTQIGDCEGESGPGAPHDDGVSCKENEVSGSLSNEVVHKETASSAINGLKPCSSSMIQPDVSSPETNKKNADSAEVQGLYYMNLC